jgi:hypothetical protein
MSRFSLRTTRTKLGTGFATAALAAGLLLVPAQAANAASGTLTYATYAQCIAAQTHAANSGKTIFRSCAQTVVNGKTGWSFVWSD